METNEKQLTIPELLEIGKMNLSILNKWEKNFLVDAERILYGNSTISEKQEGCLRKIIDEVCKELERMHAFSSHQLIYLKN